MLPINIFQEQHNSHYIHNENFQDECLTRISCKTVFNSLLNEALFEATSVPNYQTPSSNTGWFSGTSTEWEKTNAQKLKTIVNFNE